MFGAHVSCAEGLWFESNYLYFTLTPVSMLTTVESFHPDILLLIQTNTLYFLELKVGFETKKENNSDRKATKYCSLIKGLSLSLILKIRLSILLWVLLGLWALPPILCCLC